MVQRKLALVPAVLALLLITLEDVLSRELHPLVGKAHVAVETNDGGFRESRVNGAEGLALHLMYQLGLAQEKEYEGLVDGAETQRRKVLIQYKYPSCHPYILLISLN